MKKSALMHIADVYDLMAEAETIGLSSAAYIDMMRDIAREARRRIVKETKRSRLRSSKGRVK